MNDSEVVDVLEAVLSYPLPPGIERTVASDMESSAVVVLMTSSERFYVLKFRRAISAERVHTELAGAVESLLNRGRPRPFTIDAVHMGRDM
jgi:hypothetical protein